MAMLLRSDALFDGRPSSIEEWLAGLASMSDAARLGKDRMAECYAHYRHDGRNWIVQFADPDISTYGRTLARAMRCAREALAVWLNLSSVDELETHDATVLDLVELPGGMTSPPH